MVLEKLKCIVKRELHDYIGLNEGCVEIDGACHIELASQVCLVSKIDNTLQRLNLADLWSHRHHHPIGTLMSSSSQALITDQS